MQVAQMHGQIVYDSGTMRSLAIIEKDIHESHTLNFSIRNIPTNIFRRPPIHLTTHAVRSTENLPHSASQILRKGLEAHCAGNINDSERIYILAISLL